MTPHWTFISNELMRTSSCPIGAQRSFFKQAVHDLNIPRKKLGHLQKWLTFAVMAHDTE